MIRAVALLVGLVCPLWTGVAAAEEIIFLEQPGLPIRLDPHFQASLRPEPYKTPPRDLVALRTVAKNISQQAIVHVLIKLVTVDGGQVRRGMTALSLDPHAPGHEAEIDLWVGSGDRWLLDPHELTVAWVWAVGFMGGATWYADDEAVIMQLAKLEVGLAEGRPVESLATGSGLLLDDQQEDATLKDVARHVLRMYGVANPGSRKKIRKWVGPVKYFYGAFNSESDRIRFEAAMQYFARLTGLAVRKSDAPNEDVSIFIIFTSDFAAQTRSGFLRQIFKRDDESDEDYYARMASVEPAGGSMQWVGSNEGIVQYYVAVLNGAGLRTEAIHGYVLRSLFDVFTFTDEASDVIRPSIKNIGSPSTGTDLLPSVDEAFISALYGSKIRNGTPLTEALPLIVAHMYRDLYRN